MLEQAHVPPGPFRRSEDLLKMLLWCHVWVPFFGDKFWWLIVTALTNKHSPHLCSTHSLHVIYRRPEVCLYKTAGEISIQNLGMQEHVKRADSLWHLLMWLSVMNSWISTDVHIYAAEVLPVQECSHSEYLLHCLPPQKCHPLETLIS